MGRTNEIEKALHLHDLMFPSDSALIHSKVSLAKGVDAPGLIECRISLTSRRVLNFVWTERSHTNLPRQYYPPVMIVVVTLEVHV